jgi:hypothetical protein
VSARRVRARRVGARLASTVAALALAASLGGAWALEITVEPPDGELAAAVEAAVEDWRAAGVDVDAVEATVGVRVGTTARFGPDVTAWVVVRGGASDADRGFEILVGPDARSPRAALIPALGVVLGGTLGRGALDPVLDPAGPRRPTPADGLALTERLSAVPGDLDRDGRVDFEDLLLMAEAFGRRGVNLPADLDGDGLVDAADLDLLRESYVFDPPNPSRTR